MYNYKTERERVFTDSGQRYLLVIRDRVKKLLSLAGAFRMEEATKGMCGDSWLALTCVDRLVEIGEIQEIDAQTPKPGQHRIFISVD